MKLKPLDETDAQRRDVQLVETPLLLVARVERRERREVQLHPGTDAIALDQLADVRRRDDRKALEAVSVANGEPHPRGRPEACAQVDAVVGLPGGGCVDRGRAVVVASGHHEAAGEGVADAW